MKNEKQTPGRKSERERAKGQEKNGPTETEWLHTYIKKERKMKGSV